MKRQKSSGWIDFYGESTVVGALIVGAAIVTTGAQTTQVTVLTNALFGVASFLGLWLVVSILRSGRLR
ncbi:MAG: hypothetical protein ACRC8A_11985 [Microcoleaceae cyanobacterium]